MNRAYPSYVINVYHVKLLPLVRREESEHDISFCLYLPGKQLDEGIVWLKQDIRQAESYSSISHEWVSLVKGIWLTP